MRGAGDLDGTALLVVDVQNDFCPGGPLAVYEGDAVVPVANRVMPRFPTVVLTQDWHPADHSSFAASHPGKEPYWLVDMPYGPQMLWPEHCVQGTGGASFHKNLDTGRAHTIVRKGYRTDIDSYSAFFENDRETPTGLDGYLRSQRTDQVAIVGLALDFCVYYSAMDAIGLGYGVTVIEDGCRGIDLHGSLATAMTDMRNAGVNFICSDAL